MNWSFRRVRERLPGSIPKFHQLYCIAVFSSAMDRWLNVFLKHIIIVDDDILSNTRKGTAWPGAAEGLADHTYPCCAMLRGTEASCSPCAMFPCPRWAAASRCECRRCWWGNDAMHVLWNKEARILRGETPEAGYLGRSWGSLAFCTLWSSRNRRPFLQSHVAVTESRTENFVKTVSSWHTEELEMQFLVLSMRIRIINKKADNKTTASACTDWNKLHLKD